MKKKKDIKKLLGLLCSYSIPGKENKKQRREIPTKD
jgi:hypothetical protein